MDTDSDFIQPEFLNILFFQQKNLVIFPYVDLKHLHGLEIFTVGYNVVDLESTALHNLKEILEFESSNSYSQNPTLYFIYNVDLEKVKELMELDGIRCIINSNENLKNLANGNKFIFFNKKNNQFLNYGINDSELEFENSLIKNSQDEDILQENIQKIKIASTRVFKELNQAGNLENLPSILAEYEKKYWKSILDFTSKYYEINIPDISGIQFKPTKILKDYSDEYDVLISTNRVLGKEFIQLLHDYRSKRVNPAHLELEELYNPQKLYNYLRNHHWKEGVPKAFIQEWSQMNLSNYQLTEADQSDFDFIINKIDKEYAIENSSSIRSVLPNIKSNTSRNILKIPSPETEWNKYIQWASEHLTELECLTSSEKIQLSKILSNILNEISELVQNFNQNEKKVRKEHSYYEQKPSDPSNKLMIVDITNILNLDKQNSQELKVQNIIKVHRAIFSLGYKPVMIADASMRHHVDDRDLYKELVNNGTVIQSPAGIKADEYILEVAKSENSKFLTNDKFEEYWDEFGLDWIKKNRVTCLFFNGKFIIREEKPQK
jgi:hypothetical protein